MTKNRFAAIPILTIALFSLAIILPPFLNVLGQNPLRSPRPGVPLLARRPIVTPSGVLSNSGSVPPSAFPGLNFFHGRIGTSPARFRLPNGNPIFFNPAIYSSGGVYAYSVSVGDFNGDGKADLVVANQCPQSKCNSGSVTVLLGNGDGTFQTKQSYASGGYEGYSVAVGDVNGDGNADLIVANGCQSANQCGNGEIGVLLGNGDGTFQAAKSYSSGGVVASSVVIADVNKDGHADLVVTNQCLDGSCTSGGVSVLLGNGNGTFQAAQSYASGGLTAVSVAVGDFNQDHKMDLVVANQCQSSGNCNGNVGVLLGNGKGTFQVAQTYSSGGYRAVSVAVDDFNGDRVADLVWQTNARAVETAAMAARVCCWERVTEPFSQPRTMFPEEIMPPRWLSAISMETDEPIWCWPISARLPTIAVVAASACSWGTVTELFSQRTVTAPMESLPSRWIRAIGMGTERLIWR